MVHIARTIESALKRAVRDSPPVQRAIRRYLRRRHEQCDPQWHRLLSKDRAVWQAARDAARTGPKVLIATATGGHPSSPLMESLLAVALTLRGADVHFLLCDSVLPACLIAENRLMTPARFAREGPRTYFCTGCFEHAQSMYEPLGLPIHRFSDFVGPDDLLHARALSSSVAYEDIKQHAIGGIPTGEHAVAGALRFFARADLAGQSHAEAVLRRYLEAAIVTEGVVRRLFEAHPFDSACLNHALYVPQGIVAATARANGATVAAWNVAYRKGTFIFSHGETYHHTMMTEPASEWENMTWSGDHDRDILDYLNSRRRSGRDWIAFQDKNPEEDLTSILQSLGISTARPVIGMLTNVAWDAQLHYPANAFPDMLDWVLNTIRYFASRPDVHLVIRVHPAEVSGGIRSRQPVVEEVARAFPELPGNITIIPPESRIGTYAVMEACDAVIIYGTKTGVELTSLGIPVIVAGEAWIRNKGVTIDARSPEDYYGILDQLPLGRRMGDDQIARARKYAYHFFFRRMIPLTAVAPTGLKEPQFKIDLSSLTELQQGRDRGLDVVCDGILTGTPFVYPAEESGTSDAER